MSVGFWRYKVDGVGERGEYLASKRIKGLQPNLGSPTNKKISN